MCLPTPRLLHNLLLVPLVGLSQSAASNTGKAEKTNCGDQLPFASNPGQSGRAEEELGEKEEENGSQSE